MVNPQKTRTGGDIMNRKKSVILTALAAGIMTFVVARFANAGDVVVITHKGVAQSSVNTDAVKKIYSGYMSKWPDNQTIVLTVMEKSDAHKDFLKSYVGKTESQFSSTWKKMMFSGQGSYPKQFENAQSLVDFVEKTPGAIGYVEKGAKTDGVNVIK